MFQRMYIGPPQGTARIFLMVADEDAVKQEFSQSWRNVVINVQRREFLTTLAHGGICVMCAGLSGTLVSSCTNPEDASTQSSVPLTPGDPVIDLAAESSLQSIGGAVKKRYSAINSGRTIIVVRISSSGFAAFAAQCTHQGSEINLPISGTMTCPNHGSKFNASTGGVVQGPAASSLPHFTAVFDSGKNTVTIT